MASIAGLPLCVLHWELQLCKRYAEHQTVPSSNVRRGEGCGHVKVRGRHVYLKCLLLADAVGFCGEV
jgi:hypothetical protein